MKSYATFLIWMLVIAVAVIRVYNYSKFQSNTRVPSDPDEFRLQIKTKYENNLHQVLDSPHAELVSGMVLGSKSITTKDKAFYDTARQVGVVHVLVVSGYNISLVLESCRKILIKLKIKSVRLILFISVVFYSYVCSFQPPVARACFSSVAFLAMDGKVGRRVNSKLLLILIFLLLIIVWPGMFSGISIYLSFMATYGLMVSGNFTAPFSAKKGFLNIILTDFICSIVVQAYVWPIISYKFGTISLISPFINALILWCIAPITNLGFLALFGSLISPYLGNIFSFLVYPLLQYFVVVVTIFKVFAFMSIRFKLSIVVLIFYYIALEFLRLRLEKKFIGLTTWSKEP